MSINEEEFSFTFARSSGSGGQNVNKVNSKVTLIWNIQESKSLNAFQKKRFIKKFSTYLNSNGYVKVVSQKYRTQTRNIADAIEKVQEMFETIKFSPKKRLNTKPTKSSIQKRIKTKKSKGETKKSRQKVKF